MLRCRENRAIAAHCGWHDACSAGRDMHHRMGPSTRMAMLIILCVSVALAIGCGASAVAETPTTTTTPSRAPLDARSTVANATEPSSGQACGAGSVYFGLDSSQLDEASRLQLTCIPRSSARVSLVGMTDPRGTEEYNLALGERRARTVAEHLGRLGYDSTRIEARSLGEEAATGKTEPEWAHDRRVSFAAQ
jgi:peptidoglycan-associated lipoprotein